MTLCKYYLQGNCRNTASTCRFEHRQPFIGEALPPGVTKSALIGNSPVSKPVGVPQFTEDSVRTDLTTERPLWPFSSYTPGRGDGLALISGRDISPEELRLKAYAYQASRRMQQYESEVQTMINETQNETSNILSDLKTALATLTSRNSSSNATTQPAASTQTDAYSTKFGSTTVSTLGQSARPSAFGSVSGLGGIIPTFGSNSQLASSTFGQSSSVSESSAQASPFKATSSFGSSATPAFGAPSQLGNSVFGQSTFGSTASKSPFSSNQPTSVFGQTSLPSATSTFGQTSTPVTTFGQTSQPASVFGQTGKPTSVFGSTNLPTSCFGQTSQPKSVFGANSATSSTGSTFGQVAVFGQSTQPKSPFSQPNTTAPANATTFGTSSTSVPAFGTGTAQSTSIFGQSSRPISVFGQSTFDQQMNQPTANQTATLPSQAGSTWPASGSNTSGFGTTQPAFGSTSASSLGSNPAQSSTKSSGKLLKQGAPDPPLESDLPAEILEAFKATKFVIGKIPEIEPPLSVR